MKNLICSILAIFLFSSAHAASLNTKTKVLWVGQYVSNEAFYFAAEDKDPTCSHTATSGHYRVEGSNAKSIYSMLLAAASSGKSISFSISGCLENGRALVNEMYYWAN